MTGGNANGVTLPDFIGGGMLNYDSSSPTVSNCTFTGNTARNGGDLNNEADSHPTIIDCVFDG